MSVAAAIGELPDDATYLQPYPLPNVSHQAVLSVAEILGPFAGARIAKPRLLPEADANLAASNALWQASQQVTGVVWPEAES